MTYTMLPAPPPVTEPPAPRRRNRGFLVAALVVAILVVGGAEIVALDGEEAQAGPLALAFTAGETQRYRIEQTMDVTLGGDLAAGVTGPMTIETAQTVSWEVTDVDADRVATVRVTSEDTSGSVNGIPIPSMGATPAIELRISASGRVLSVGGPALGGSSLDLSGGPFGQLLQMPGSNQFTPLLPPDADAQVGDSWDVSFSQDIPYGTGTVDVDATSTYDREETVDDAETAVIVTDSTIATDMRLDVDEIVDALVAAGVTGPTGMPDLAGAGIVYEGSGTTTQTSWLDLDTRDLVKTSSEGDLDVTMSFEGFPDVSGTMTMTARFEQELTRL